MSASNPRHNVTHFFLMHHAIPHFVSTVYTQNVIKMHVLQLLLKFKHLFIIVADTCYKIIITS